MNGVGRACARFPDGDRLDALADVLATEATPVVAEHIDGCPVCGPALADLQAVLPAVKWTGATGAFAFRRVNDKSGKPAGYDANQSPIVSTTRGKNYEIER